MKYTDLIFDLYGTLVDIRTQEDDTVWEKTALYFGYYGLSCSGKALKAAFEDVVQKRQIQAGQSYECFPDIPIEEVFAQLAADKGMTENVHSFAIQAAQLFRICATEYIRLYPGVLKALEQLRAKGCRLWLLSNAQRVFTAYELRQLGLENQFDGVYISSDYGFRKPDKRFYRALLQERKLQIQNCMMIGNDRETDIAGAKALGMATLYLHSNITPSAQAPADPALHPHTAPDGCCHWEVEDARWDQLLLLLEAKL